MPSHPEATPLGLLCSRTPAGMLPRRHEGSFSGAAWLLVPGHLVAERVGRRWHGELRAPARSVLASGQVFHYLLLADADLSEML